MAVVTCVHEAYPAGPVLGEGGPTGAGTPRHRGCLVPAVEGVVGEDPPVRPVVSGYGLRCGATWALAACVLVGDEVRYGEDVDGRHIASRWMVAETGLEPATFGL